MAQSNNGQVGVRKGALDSTNRARFTKGRPLSLTVPTQIFGKVIITLYPGSVFNMIDLMNNEIESMSGTKGFSGGISGSSLGNSATAARGALDAASLRRMHIGT